jgi:squalene-hopene/tetraprenyl-beta-curcumene cyclase
MIYLRKCTKLVCILILGVSMASLSVPTENASAATEQARLQPGEALPRAQQILDKAAAFLKAQQQKDGSWQRNDREPPAVTALALRVLVQNPKHDPASGDVKRAVAYLLALQKPDGGIHNGMLANYNTAIIVSALTALHDPALKDPIDKAVAYLKATQAWEESSGGEKVDATSPLYGGWGYGGGRGRPDLSNTAVVLDALKDAGLKEDDPAYQRALKFVSRLQNHSESNPAPWAGNDGGFIYSPGRDGGGESSAGEYTSNGKRMLRSYGSMTYAGLKSMIYAGLTRSDPRVKAAWEWVRSTWTLDENPGMAAAGPEAAKSGIFYYYNTLAKALAVYGQPIVQDSLAAHDWRVELIDKLGNLQKDDGSFVGDRRWMEDNPIIATTLATLALQDAMRDLREHPSK